MVIYMFYIVVVRRVVMELIVDGLLVKFVELFDLFCKGCVFGK